MARPQVNIRVSEDQKDRWESYVGDSPEYDTLTDLIRTSVEREIATEGQSLSVDTSAGSDERIGEVLTAVEKMAHRVNELEATITDATLAMHEATTDSDLSSEVYNELPIGEERAITATELADKIDAEPENVSVTLSRLEHNTNAVKRIDTTEKPHPEAAPQVSETYWYRVN
ncbi:hypothetical protein ACFR99_15055 [Haloarchaeobius amylolyticus]|uniref:Uncharacterized protein n=1 Tax=Haloarchaeobius amylolyticus TaxID=1198296 RepID=A0ABD6BIP9_9EURY